MTAHVRRSGLPVGRFMGYKSCTMKTILLILGCMTLLSAFALGDTLDADKIKITGVILQQSETGKGTIVKPVTMGNLLNLLGLSGTNPKSVRYYYDDSADGGYVIAPVGIASGSSATPLANIVTLGIHNAKWNGEVPLFVFGGNSSVGFNGELSGGVNVTGVASKNRMATERSTVVLSGTLNGVLTTVNMSISDTYKNELMGTVP